jgi:hypothetical protein
VFAMPSIGNRQCVVERFRVKNNNIIIIMIVCPVREFVRTISIAETILRVEEVQKSSTDRKCVGPTVTWYETLDRRKRVKKRTSDDGTNPGNDNNIYFDRSDYIYLYRISNCYTGGSLSLVVHDDGNIAIVIAASTS